MHSLLYCCVCPLQVDVIFDDSYTAAASNLLDMAAFTAAYGTEAETLPAVVAGKVYAFNNKLAKSNDDTVATDWFESATARPDQVRTGAVGVHRLWQFVWDVVAKIM